MNKLKGIKAAQIAFKEQAGKMKKLQETMEEFATSARRECKRKRVKECQR